MYICNVMSSSSLPIPVPEITPHPTKINCHLHPKALPLDVEKGQAKLSNLSLHFMPFQRKLLLPSAFPLCQTWIIKIPDGINFKLLYPWGLAS